MRYKFYEAQHFPDFYMVSIAGEGGYHEPYRDEEYNVYVGVPDVDRAITSLVKGFADAGVKIVDSDGKEVAPESPKYKKLLEVGVLEQLRHYLNGCRTHNCVCS